MSETNSHPYCAAHAGIGEVVLMAFDPTVRTADRGVGVAT